MESRLREFLQQVAWTSESPRVGDYRVDSLLGTLGTGAWGHPMLDVGQLAWGFCVLPDLINLIAPLTTVNPRDAAQNEKKAPPIQPTTPGLLEIE
jgi:hypothetical protein